MKLKNLLFTCLLSLCALSISAQKAKFGTLDDMRSALQKTMSKSIDNKEFIVIVDQVFFTDPVFNPAGGLVYLDELNDDVAPTGDEEAGTIRMTPEPYFLAIKEDTAAINLPYTRIVEHEVTVIKNYFVRKTKKGKYVIQFEVDQPRATYTFRIQINSAGRVKMVITGRNEKQPLTFYGNISLALGNDSSENKDKDKDKN